MKFKFPHIKDFFKSKIKSTEEEKKALIEAAFNSGNMDESQFRNFGSELIPLILNRVDYEGFIRSVFTVHQHASSSVVFTLSPEEEDYFSQTRKALQEVRDILDKRP